MISRIAGRTLVQAFRRSVPSAGLLTTPTFSFSRKIEKVPSNFNKSLEDEIKAEE